MEARRKTSADLDDSGRELAAAQLQGVNAERELTNLRAQLTLASNQLAGVKMQYEAERARHTDGEAEREDPTPDPNPDPNPNPNPNPNPLP